MQSIFALSKSIRERAGIGRQNGLKIRRAVKLMRVQVPPLLPTASIIMELTESTRPTKSVSLVGLCSLSSSPDYVEATEWTNGEGIDFYVDSRGGKEKFSLTYGEAKAVTLLTTLF